jgi:hypothetical protein
MEIKTTKIEYKELLLLLERASNFISDKGTKAKDMDLSRRLVRAKCLLEKRNGEA